MNYKNSRFNEIEADIKFEKIINTIQEQYNKTNEEKYDYVLRIILQWIKQNKISHKMMEKFVRTAYMYFIENREFRCIITNSQNTRD